MTEPKTQGCRSPGWVSGIPCVLVVWRQPSSSIFIEEVCWTWRRNS